MITNNNEGSVTQIQDGGDDMLVMYAKLLVVYSFFCVLHFVKWQKNRGPLLQNIPCSDLRIGMRICECI